MLIRVVMPQRRPMHPPNSTLELMNNPSRQIFKHAHPGPQLFSKNSFASLIFEARYGLPPLSG